MFLLGLLLALHPFTRAIDYPLALASALPASLVYGVAGALSRSETVGAQLRSGFVLVIAGIAAFCVPPAAASLVSEHACEPSTGLLFVALGPLSSALVAFACGMFLGRVVVRRWLAVTLFCVLLLGSLAVPVAEFFFTPMVRFYGTFFGMYHGAVYDKAVFVETPYLFLRLWNLAGVAALLLLTVKSKIENRRWKIENLPAWGVSAVWVALALASPWLGFTGSTSRLLDKMSGKLESPRFVLHFAAGGRAEQIADLTLKELDYQAGRLDKLFSLPRESDRIDVFLYEDARHKGALMGAGATSVAKPWLRQLHVHTHSMGDPLLTHELAHVMLGALSPSALKLPASFGFVPLAGVMEGAAVGAERGGGLLTTHQWARAMRDIGRAPDMEDILTGAGFWTRSAPLAYTASGSFVSFLLERFGPECFARLYGGAGFDEAYGSSIGELLGEWNAFLDSVVVAPEDLDLAEFVFSRPPVFRKVCPFAGGRCLEEAVLELEQGNSIPVIRLARKAANLTGHDFRLGLKFVRLLYAAGQPGEGLDLLEWVSETGQAQGAGQARGTAPATGGQAFRDEALLAEADGLWLSGEPDDAIEIYARLASTPAARRLDPGLSFRLALASEEAPLAILATSAHTLAEGERLASDLGLRTSDSLSPAARIRIAFTMAGYRSLFPKAISILKSDLPALGDDLPQIAWHAQFLLARLCAAEGRLDEARNTLARLVPRTPAEQESIAAWVGRIGR